MSKAAALGLDVGSTTTKLVAVDPTGSRVWSHLEAADPRVEQQVTDFLERAAADLGPVDHLPLVATGYGRKLVPGARRRVTEITCHARGVHSELGHGGTLVDIGGQDSKVIVLADDGKVVNFAMNDKCAAGTGRFLEHTASRLRVELDRMGPTALGAPEEVSISSTCTVFAESEIISRIARGSPVDAIVRGLHRSLVERIAAMARGAGATSPILLSGGVARNDAVRVFLGEALGAEVRLPDAPQLMGAYGAALLALR
ncbi:MAG: acyl-CoA dehydratase activase [Myxococcota bacterium]